MDVYDYVLQNCKEMDLKKLKNREIYEFDTFYSIIKTKQVVENCYYCFIGDNFDTSKFDFEDESIFSLGTTSSGSKHIFFDYDNYNKCNYVYCTIKDNKIEFETQKNSKSPEFDLPIDVDNYFNYSLLYNIPPYEDILKMQEIVNYLNEQNTQIELQVYKNKFKDDHKI